MKKNKLIVFVLLFLMKITPVVSQIDTVFWFAPPWVTPDHWWKDDVKFHIATFNTATTVRMRQPASIYDTTFTVPANTNVDINYWMTSTKGYTNGPVPYPLGFDSLETRPANVVRTNGFKITSSTPITVVFDYITRSDLFLNPETFSLKGQNGMGTEFACPFQIKWFNKNLTNLACPTLTNQGGRDLNCDGVLTQPKQQINIVSTSYNTIIWITPKCNVVGHSANITYSVFLPNPGDAYTVENAVQTTSLSGMSLSGSIVVSNKPISVTVADDSVNPGNIPNVTSCFDLMGDQIVPVDVVGTDYIVNKGQLNGPTGEAIFIVGTQNFTQLTIDDGTISTYTINKGETKQYDIVKPLTSVIATKNVYLFHASGYGCELGAAILPPLNCAGSNLVAFSRNNNQQFALNILCKNGAQNTFTLNGSTTLVPPTAFTVVPGAGGYVGAQIPFTTAQIPVGISELLSNSVDVFALGIINGDVTTGGLFHYMSSFRRNVFTDAGSDFTICASSNTIALSGTITGGAITGIWDTPTGTVSPTIYTSSITTVSMIYTLTPSQLFTGGSLTFTLTSVGNCTNVSDIVTLNIVKAPVVTATPSVVTRCKNNLTPVAITGVVTGAPGQNWSGGNGAFFPATTANTSYTPSPTDASAGTVILTLTSTGGCAPASGNVVINFTNPPSVLTPPDINACTNTHTIAIIGATITGGSSTGIWSTNGGGYFTPSDTTFNTNYVLSASETATGGIVTLTLTSTNNGLCASVTSTLNINIFPKPIVSAGSDSTYCPTIAGSVISFTGSATFNSAPTTPTWSTIGGTGAFSNPNSPITNYTITAADLAAGCIKFVIGAKGICSNSETDTMQICFLKLPTISAGSNALVCDNTTIMLTGAVTNYTGAIQWIPTTGTGTFTPSDTNLITTYIPSAADILSGSVTFSLVTNNSKGCSNFSDSVKIVFKSSPVANFNIGTACVNSLVNFTDASTLGPVVTHTMYFGEGFPTSAPGTIITPHTYSLAGTYYVTYSVTSSNGCMDTIVKPIVINPLPVADFNFNNACQGLPASFQDASFVNPGNITGWNWNFGDGIKDTINKNPPHVYALPGLYNVVLIVTSSKGCKNLITKPVTVNPQPTAEFGLTNNPTLALETVYFSDFSTPSGSIVNWYWNFGDSSSASGQSPTHFFNNQGNYYITLTVIDGNGCRDSITKSIEVTLLPLVPTAFSPNGDGNNDFLFVKGGPFQKMNFRVYNSWGEKIFESTEQKNGWDGKLRGEDCPVGVYVWVLDVDMYNNKSVRKTGDVTILR